MIRRWLTLFILTLLVTGALLFSLQWGTHHISLSAMGRAMMVEDDNYFSLYQHRLPRALLALLLGAALAVSGVLVQAVIRNPLASPDILGINHAASLVAVIALTLLPALEIFWLPPLAFAGGCLAFLLLRTLAGKTSPPPLRLALTGIALAAFYASLTDYLLLSRPMEINSALLWLTGSLWGRGWPFLSVAAPVLLLLLPLSLWFCRDLDVLALGDDSATALGTAVVRTQYLALLTAVALAAIGVAVCGPIGFIGLVVPHLARRLIGGRHCWLVPAAMLTGALLLLLADLLGRILHPPLELPAGVLTAIIGAPYFFWLLVRIR